MASDEEHCVRHRVAAAEMIRREDAANGSMRLAKMNSRDFAKKEPQRQRTPWRI